MRLSFTQNNIDLLFCILNCCMSCVSFLPQELSCPQEGLRMLEFPSLQYKSKHKHQKANKSSFGQLGFYINTITFKQEDYKRKRK